METESLIFSFFLIFTGAAIVSTLALYFRQPLLVAYIALGVVLGPYGLSYISDPSLLTDISEFGIIFLLFLLGLDMQPGKLFITLKKVFLVTLASSIIFVLLGFGTGLLFEYSLIESLVIDLALFFPAPLSASNSYPPPYCIKSIWGS
jgi:Kef-type K+ transport system membrane component KefB